VEEGVGRVFGKGFTNNGHKNSRKQHVLVAAPLSIRFYKVPGLVALLYNIGFC